ncbi:MAG: T9SS type A sorting domain-containing protein [Candidatus Azobacteroides sp.]|nr:T9SS type A sorting domain-containing protein [Candidatus Azobacteroides sp.]
MNKELLIKVLYALLLVLFLPAGGYAQSQSSTFRANTDNVFVTPGAYVLINVLNNDELGECEESTVNLSIQSIPQHGSYLLNTSSKVIRYIPQSGFTGKDSLSYELECNGKTSTAWVYLNVNDKPDNMEMDVCAITPPSTSWDIEQVGYTNEFVHVFAQPFVGDIDNDGQQEIIAVNQVANNLSDLIYIFNPDLTLKRSIPMPADMETFTAYPLLIADVDRDGFGEIIIGTGKNDGYKLYCFRYDGTLMWTSAYSYFKNTPPATGAGNSVGLIIGDINNDGYPEVVAGDRIFDAVTGNLLADLPDGPRGGMMSSTGYGYLPAMADFDNDGQLEIACGSCVYKATITDRSAAAYVNGSNSVSILSSVSAQLDATRIDGFTSVADIDGDGYLDVVVVNGTAMNATTIYNQTCLMYAWSPRRGVVLDQITPPSQGRTWMGSRAFIGDVTGNGEPDICFTYGTQVNNVNGGGMAGYSYNKSTGKFMEIFSGITSDTSGATTMSMFDFDLDGEVELVYRDETDMRIIDKDGIDRITFPCFSWTHTEYPVIVDIDKNGHADIIVSGSLTKDERATKVRLIHYRHPQDEWAKCRTVNHQHAYNPVYINEDLTIPQYPINPVTEFVSKDGTKRSRPFNHFLQQVGDLNSEGETLSHGPDLYFDKNFRNQMEWDAVTDKLNITLGINNQGDGSYTGNLQVSTFLIDENQNPTVETLVGDIVLPSMAIAQNQFTSVSYELNNISTLLQSTPYTTWEIRLNWDEVNKEYPKNMEECRYYNNVTNKISLVTGEHVMCESIPGDITTCEWVKLSPKEAYTYYWYDTDTPAGIAEAIHEGDSMMVCKDHTPVQTYYIQIWDKNKTQLLSDKLEPVEVYLFPDSLIWTGLANDQDWHNYENWFNPTGTLYPNGNVPRSCTNVLIPDVVSNYPDLSPQKTRYDNYSHSECANISFEYGGEVANPDSLIYQKAYVQLSLLSNRWYMLSSPLQDFYPGDYYVRDPNPCEDDVFVYTRLFGMKNPHSGQYVEADWTGTFHNPNLPLEAGLGFSLWIDDKQPDASIHDSIAFSFPKYDPYYIVYGTNCSKNYWVKIDRDNHHRFVFEKNMDPVTGKISLSSSATVAKHMTIVGNPFMATLDFEQFYNYNDTYINDYYQILDENDGNFVSFQLGGISTGTLTQYIAPMQSILIESKQPFSELYTFGHMTTTQPGAKLRSAGTYPNPDVLSMTVSKDNQQNKTVLVYHKNGIEQEKYGPVPKIFMEDVTAPVSVFLLNKEDKFMDILHDADLDGKQVYLGLRTDQTGTLRLDFEGTNRFAPEYDIYLTDMEGEKPTQVNIRIFPYYEFDKSSEDLFLTDRFYLSFSKRMSTDILQRTDPVINTSVEVFSANGTIKVISVDRTPLKEVQLYDLQGKLICHKKGINDFRTEIEGATDMLYILKAKTEKSSKTVKIYTK